MGVLEAGLGGLERLLNDDCVLLNGLGRFQNALGAFQKAPERETLIFHWFWKVLLGGVPRTCRPGGWLPDPLNIKTDQTPLVQGKGKRNGLG